VSSRFDCSSFNDLLTGKNFKYFWLYFIDWKNTEAFGFFLTSDKKKKNVIRQ